MSVSDGLPTVFILKEAFERAGLMRSELDTRFNLTDQEFKVEGRLIAVGPLPSDDMVGPLLEFLESRGLAYFDEVFELSGNWPTWLRLFAM
jgi:hypothetical protein